MRRGVQRASRARDQHGAAVVEFALIAPLLIMLVFGIIDYGYMLNRDTMLNNAVRDGARVASLDGSYSEIVSSVTSELQSVGIPTTSPTTTITVDCIKVDGTACAVNGVAATYDAAAVSGSTAIVKVTYKHSWLTPVLGVVGSSSVTLSQETRMRVE
jgi:Flp pilus assembly protein TadG